MSRPRAITAIVVLLLAGVVSVATARPNKTGLAVPSRLGGTSERESRPRAATDRRASRRPSVYWKLERRYVAQQHELGRLGREVRRLRREHAARTLQAVGGSSAGYAIRLASSAFGVSEGEMRSVADCETGGTFSPTAYNAGSGAAGLFQFLGGTWANQGLAGFSVYNAVANALAAARIVAREGWAQWSCRPDGTVR